MTSPTPKKSSLVSAEINNSVLLMARTGAGKSSLLCTLAEYVWRTYRKVTLFYSSDGGGYPTHVQALIHKGIMRVWRLRSRSGLNDVLALETTMKASRGWWPAQIQPLSGACDPNARLVPPVTAVIEVVAPDGIVLATIRRDSEAQGRTFTHPVSKAKIGPTNAPRWSLRKVYRPTKGFEDVGAVCYDGLTSCSDWWTNDLAGRQARLEIAGEKSALGGIILSGDEKMGGGNRAQVGFAQKRAQQMVDNAQGVPNLVVPPVFTALTLDMSDEKTNQAVCGPLLAGVAKTPVAAQWFGNVLEPVVYRNDAGHDCFRLYVDAWEEPKAAGGRRHLTKNRAGPGVLPLYLDDPPPVQEGDRLLYPGAWSQVNLGVFFELLEKGLSARLATLDADPTFKDAPGVPEVMEYGEAGLSATVAAKSAPPKAAPAPRAPAPSAPKKAASAPAATPLVPVAVTPANEAAVAKVVASGQAPARPTAAVTTVKAPAPAARRRKSPAKPKPTTTMTAVPAAPPGTPMPPATPPTLPT